ncbi:BRCA1-associated RING domain protein 1-like [Zerene cesonia]|uniref:BRCA1-associated RING domain protein 1-like n=1 Tax=Zerene cesonia TaxID=33412 RepID=UPI0018E506C8|nr:BRCA1-associated RING domain protein 1-like [Zerene cesonia]
MSNKMSSEKLNKFLKALDAVKQDYTCGVCSKLCVKPVSLSACFHFICAEHFQNLKQCPTCNMPLDGCSTYTNDDLEKCVESAKELDKIFQNCRPQDSKVLSVKKRANATEESHSGKENKRVLNKNTPDSEFKKPKNKSDLNASLASTASSKKGIEKKNTKGETSLHVACRQGKVDTVLDLLNQGANSNTKDNAGWTPLHEVVQNGKLEIVKALLQFNTLINVPGPSNETPLHEAVRYNRRDIAVELVKHGADLYTRNCKGETPLQLASEDMKAALLDAADNLLQTQGFNITIIANAHSELDFEDVRVFCVSQFRTVINKLKLLTKHHSNLHVEAKFTTKVTHLIVDVDDDVCTSSVDVLQAIVYGIWVISSKWVTKSAEQHLEQFQDYEVKGVGNRSYNGPKNSRYNKYKQLPGIFNGCHFYLHNFISKYEISKTLVLTKAVLTKLITDAGGVVLRRVPNPELIPESEKLVPYHAKKGGKLEICSHYIIFKDMYEPMYNMSHIKALPVGWLIECLEKYELCEP